MTQKKAFTLVELIIVIAIVAILSVTAFLVVTKWIGKSRDARRQADLGSVERSLVTWLADYGKNPAGTLSSGSATVLTGITYNSSGVLVYQGEFNDAYLATNTNFDVLQKAPKDPSGAPYIIGIDTSKKYFNIGGTLEADAAGNANQNALIRGNFTAGNSTNTINSNSIANMPSLLKKGGSLVGSAGTYTYSGGASTTTTTGDYVVNQSTTTLVYSLPTN